MEYMLLTMGVDYVAEEKYDVNSMTMDAAQETNYVTSMAMDVNKETYYVKSVAIPSYSIWQDGLLCCTILLGVVCICHLAMFRIKSCKNAYLIATVISAGLGYILAGLTLDTSIPEMTYTRPACVDYTFPAILSTSIILTTISCNMIRRHVTTSMTIVAIDITMIVSMIIGVGVIFKDSIALSIADKQTQETIIELNSDTALVWSVCKKIIARESARLVLEYGLVYSPAMLVILYCLCRSFKQCKGIFDGSFKIIGDDCDTAEGGPCFCSSLNSTVIGILGYSFLILFLARPTLLVYISMTSGVFRDLIPGYLCIMTYFAMCIDYLLSVKTSNPRKGIHVSERKPSFESPTLYIYNDKTKEFLV